MQIKVFGGSRLGSKKLEKTNGWINKSKAALKFIILAKNFLPSVRLFFFGVMTIIQIVLRGLGKQNFHTLNGWVLNFGIL